MWHVLEVKRYRISKPGRERDITRHKRIETTVLAELLGEDCFVVSFSVKDGGMEDLDGWMMEED